MEKENLDIRFESRVYSHASLTSGHVITFMHCKTSSHVNLGRHLWELQHKHLVLKGVQLSLNSDFNQECSEEVAIMHVADVKKMGILASAVFWSYSESLADFNEDWRVCGNLGWNRNAVTETACREQLLKKLQMQVTWGFYAGVWFDWQDSLGIIWISVTLSYLSYPKLRFAPCVETCCGALF